MMILRTVMQKCGRYFHGQSLLVTSKMKLEDLVSSVEKKIKLLENADSSAISTAEVAYAAFNAQLKEQIPNLKKTLVELELQAGEFQFSIPTIPEAKTKPVAVSNKVEVKSKPVAVPAQSVTVQQAAPAASAVGSKPAASPPAKSAKGNKSVCSGHAAGHNRPVDISRLDLRVGRVMEVEKHPDADTLYIEKADLGEGYMRTVVSGLANDMPIEQVKNLTTIFVCNVKPIKVRGVKSKAKILCACPVGGSTWEPLVIEGNDVAMGDVVVVEGFTGEPDDQLKPKRKIFEQVKPDLLVVNHIATYKGVPWKVRGKPEVVIKAPNFANAQIS